ncbi:MAG: hypothetical protein JRI75_01150 [Deltaproteobacteria bacterium]|nr:hypothetical protein [Deltaproteobacteria bacterium]
MKEIAWNGIRFEVPVRWEVGKIGPYYLMLETERGPVLEVKWGKVRGAFSHSAHLRRLGSMHGRRSGIIFEECAVPSGWQEALDGFIVTGFSWQGKSIGGRGVILYCTACRNATLIQFYQKDSGQSEDTALPVLTSFEDHRPDGQVVWAVFDIKAVMPERFKLVRHRLAPGKYELAFEARGQKITLHRWGPAAILLRDQDIVEFAGTVTGMPFSPSNVILAAGKKVVDWKVSPSITLWRRLIGGIRREHPFKRFRLWHLEKKNRILGVEAAFKKPCDLQTFESIYAAYESL